MLSIMNINYFLKGLIKLTKSGTFVNILIVAIISIFVKGFGFYKEMEISKTFGLSIYLDTFLVALMIPGFIQNVFMTSLQNIFIPNYIYAEKSKINIANFQTSCFLIFSFLAALLIFISYFIVNNYLEQIFTNHTTEYYNLVRQQFYFLLPAILFWTLSSFVAGLLEIKRYFYLTSFYSIFTAITTLICLYTFKNDYESNALSIGLLLGSIVEFIYLLIVAISKKILKIGEIDLQTKPLKNLIKQFPAKVGSGFLSGASGIINQFFAAQLIVGSMSTLNYAIKLPSFLVSILTVAIGNVLLPLFSNLVITDLKKAYQIVYKSIIYVFVGSSVIIFFLSIYSTQIIQLLFERGHFSEENAISVGKIQIILFIFVPFYISGVILVKFLTSLNKNIYMFYTSLILFFISLFLNLIFSRYWGLSGLAFATTSISILNFFILLKFTNLQKKLVN